MANPWRLGRTSLEIEEWTHEKKTLIVVAVALTVMVGAVVAVVALNRDGDDASASAGKDSGPVEIGESAQGTFQPPLQDHAFLDDRYASGARD